MENKFVQLFEYTKFNNENIELFANAYQLLLEYLLNDEFKSQHIELVNKILENGLLQNVVYSNLDKTVFEEIMECKRGDEENEEGFVDENEARNHTSTFMANMVRIFKLSLKIMKQILVKSPSNINELEHLIDRIELIFRYVIKNDEAIEDDLSVLHQIKESYLNQQRNFEVTHEQRQQRSVWDKQQPPEDFRKLSLTPDLSEIKSAKGLFLRKNLKYGAYDDVEHYLDVQYRLLREDYVGSLREGIIEYLARNRDNRQNVQQNISIRIYQDVVITDWIIDQNGGVVHRLRINVTKRLSKVRWETSKRLIQGSLICLTSDNFKTALFATVFDRNCDDLRKGILLVKFFNWKDLLRNDDQIGYQSFTIAETTAFFESYRYTLESLKEFNESSLPFKDHIVYAQNERIKPPGYLKNQIAYDFRPILKDQWEIVVKSHRPEYVHHITYENGKNEEIVIPEVIVKRYEFKTNDYVDVQVMESQYWPTAELLGLDASQYSALKLALTSELVVIQGPPGAGKTFIGIQILRMLLHNKQFIPLYGLKPSNGPILIVCYTNHALDQFLTLISKYVNEGTEDIVRIGRRSKEPKMEQYALHELKARFKVLSKFRDTQYALRVSRRELKTAIDRLEKMAKNMRHDRIFSLRNFTYKLERYEHLFDSLTDREIREFYHINGREFVDDKVFDKVFEDWLGIGSLPTGVKRHDIDAAIELHSESKNANGYAEPLYAYRDESHYTSDDIDEDGYFVARFSNLNISSVGEEAQLKEGVKEGNERIAEEAEIENESREIDADQIDKQIVNQLFRRKDEEEEQSRRSQVQNEPTGDHNANNTVDEPWNLFNWQVAGNSKRNYHNRQAIEAILNLDDRMDDDEVKKIDDLWSLDSTQRVRFYRFLHHEYICEFYEDFERLITSYERILNKFEEVREQESLDIMKNAKIIAMTTTGAAKNQRLISKLKPSIVIVEEAAEVFEAHIISCLTQSCEQLILIGDHEQLQPSPNLYKLAKNYGLNVSLFERLVNNKIPKVRLQLQHRMRPEISVYMKHFYVDLIDDECVKTYSNINGMCGNVAFIDHRHMETSDDESRTKSNEYEAEYLINLCDYLLKQNYKPEQITVLVTYGGQLLLIKNKIKSIFSNEIHRFHQRLKDVFVTPIDNYQGEENDIILLSLVRSNNFKRIGFLSISNRICVALSRAKKGFYLIGNFKHLADNSKLWANIVEQARANGTLVDKLRVKCQSHQEIQAVIEHYSDFDAKCPNGGCLQVCNERLDCGHACERKCHVTPHDDYVCCKPCTRLFDNCSTLTHHCDSLCYMPCSPCAIKIDKKMPNCGHIVAMKCSEDPSTRKCSVYVDTVLDCGHVKKVQCYQLFDYERQNIYEKYDNTNFQCDILVSKQFEPCGHVTMMRCQNLKTNPRNEDSVECQQEVEKLLEKCGHTIKTTCCSDLTEIKCPILIEMQLNCGHKITTECWEKYDELKKKCSNKCGHLLVCGHKCINTCGECKDGTKHAKCTQICGKRLLCGHQCKLSCGIPCYTCKQACQNQCSHTRCNRNCSDLCYLCRKPCTQSCSHHDCTRMCYEFCNTNCNQPCNNLLQCDHRCSSMCGELCVCAQCEVNNEDVSKKFIKLRDCKCVMELTELDRHVRVQSDATIILPTCPKCKIPIINSKRYKNQINNQQRKYHKLKQSLMVNALKLQALKQALEQKLIESDFRFHLQNYLQNNLKFTEQIKFYENRLNQIELYAKIQKYSPVSATLKLFIKPKLLGPIELSNNESVKITYKLFAAFYLQDLRKAASSNTASKLMQIKIELLKAIKDSSFELNDGYFDELLFKGNDCLIPVSSRQEIEKHFKFINSVYSSNSVN